MTHERQAGRDGDTAARIEAECMSTDKELDHIRADDILVELLRDIGFDETADAFEAVGKWYS